ncbi:MAG: DUF3575 domain-containing protein [Alistipes sp.]|nr:DUF3575 domain-containing protein [Alistipes sp.]MCD8274960.1 DUF3575 domain-containing protein [Alistipes sp.]
MRVRTVILFLALFCIRPVLAVPVADSVRIYFRHGYSVLDLSFRDNRGTLSELAQQLNAFSSDTTCCSTPFLVIAGNASPDGLNGANLRLSRKRAESVLAYIRSHTTVPDSLVTMYADGVAWDALTAQVAADPSIPARDEALDILRHTPVWIYDERGRIVDGRKKQLMELDGGRVYRILQERFFADLRNATIVLVCQAGSLVTEKSQTAVPTDLVESRVDTLSDVRSGECLDAVSSVPERVLRDDTKNEPLHRLALKTNLLYDAILMPSLEVEYRIDNRWSVNLEGEVAWWSSDSKHKYYQIATISPEVRYWFGTRKPWHGHYVGVFAGGSWYDLENGARGYKGESVMTGLSYGYMFPVGRCLSLEAGLGVGFLHTKYEEYMPIDGHYVYQQTSRTNYFGPVKLKFALVWRLWDVNRKGGGRR